MAPRSGLASPPTPAELGQFPTAATVDELHRLSEHPDPWWFDSIDDVATSGGGRFTLPRPNGTCATAEDLTGALVEKLLRRPQKLVPAERLDELFHTTARVIAAPPTADLTASRATSYGLNAEIHSSVTYERTRRWALALHAAGFRALRHRLRGDVTGRLAGWALFGRSGLHRRAPKGLRSERTVPLDSDLAAGVLEQLGVPVVPIPDSVLVVPPADEPTSLPPR